MFLFKTVLYRAVASSSFIVFSCLFCLVSLLLFVPDDKEKILNQLTGPRDLYNTGQMIIRYLQEYFE